MAGATLISNADEFEIGATRKEVTTKSEVIIDFKRIGSRLTVCDDWSMPPVDLSATFKQNYIWRILAPGNWRLIGVHK
ncbi:unannotated protein [freshwater metagenome]|uniref:Unannotated protein n=1 Tax=freshwater metagenome TaxID=449393 RepID=A0A6J6FC10_9ZZZZ